jgi:hypothetical protein
MKRFLAVMLGVFAPAAFLTGSSGAATLAPSGDTCSATGSGTSYTLVINLPANAATAVALRRKPHHRPMITRRGDE